MPVLTKINSNVIADDAISGDKLGGSAYLANTATQNISGTYSENRLYTSDAYTLSGNATVNSNLTLSSVKSTDDVVLTAGGAYTLTGTGVLSGGSLLAPQRTDLTGMTGELGSAITGSPTLNLSSATAFPTGHIIKTTRVLNTYEVTSNGSFQDMISTSYTGTVGNLLIIFGGAGLSIRAGYDNYVRISVDGAVCGLAHYEESGSTNAHISFTGPGEHSVTAVYPANGAAQTILLQAANDSSSAVTIGNSGEGNHITILEVHGAGNY